jgi:hypothetical protein
MLHLAILVAVAGLGQAEKTKVPHKNDELPLVRLKASPEKHAGKPVIICGTVSIEDDYDFAYSDAKRTHFSLRFEESGATLRESGENCYLYLQRQEGKAIVEHLTQEAEKKKGGRRSRTLVRAKVVLLPEVFERDKKWDNLEVLDVQFIDDEFKDWLPWTLQAERDAEENRAAAAAAERKKKRDDDAAEKREKAKEVADKETPEQKAAKELKLAKSLLDTNKSAAQKRLKQLIEKYPDTDAAEEARKFIDSR